MLDLDTRRPFCILKRKEDADALLLSGRIVELDALDEIPRGRGPSGGPETAFDTLSVVPFCQIRERGFPVHSDGERIRTLVIERQRRIAIPDLMEALPRAELALAGDPEYSHSDEEYAAVVRRIIDEEIGEGEGANFVIAREYRNRIVDFGPGKALSIVRSLLENEYGAYWTYLFFDGREHFVGATPERHLSVQRDAVKMNPISGTFRKPAGAAAGAAFRADLLRFLEDRKEIYELFMVVDEELKMMSALCEEGGTVVGPLLKEMSRLIHTEYLLAGRSSRDVIELLRESMFAATVTGSPMESAARVIHRFEPGSRKYYASTMALLGRDAEGRDVLDAPITIRTAQIGADGSLSIQVGATLVRDSVPEDEVKETHAKVAGLLAAIRGDGGGGGRPLLEEIEEDEALQLALSRRNAHLSRFWMDYQEQEFNAVEELRGVRVTIIENEDSFSMMLRHMMARMGAVAEVIPFSRYDLAGDSADIVVVGPGPGDPGDLEDPKIARIHAIVDDLLASDRPFMAVCLGHQVLSARLGLPLVKKDVAFQGTQAVVNLFGVKERVGFYNTFTAKADREIPNVEIAADPGSGEVHALRSDRFLGYQFHAESILTSNGYGIVRDALLRLRGR